MGTRTGRGPQQVALTQVCRRALGGPKQSILPVSQSVRDEPLPNQNCGPHT